MLILAMELSSQFLKQPEVSDSALENSLTLGVLYQMGELIELFFFLD